VNGGAVGTTCDGRISQQYAAPSAETPQVAFRLTLMVSNCTVTATGTTTAKVSLAARSRVTPTSRPRNTP